jgi:hypothetical protein
MKESEIEAFLNENYAAILLLVVGDEVVHVPEQLLQLIVCITHSQE